MSARKDNSTQFSPGNCFPTLLPLLKQGGLPHRLQKSHVIQACPNTALQASDEDSHWCRNEQANQVVKDSEERGRGRKDDSFSSEWKILA